LPAVQFDGHTWVAQDAGGVPVALAMCVVDRRGGPAGHGVRPLRRNPMTPADDAEGSGDMARHDWLEIRALAGDEIDRVSAVLGLARLEQGNGFYLVAWDGDEPLGHAHLALTDPPELQDVSVRPEFRRRGVASALTAVAEDEARARGFDRLTLTVSVENAAAQALYRRCGYADTGVPPRRVQGTIIIRTGPIDVDDTLLTWDKALRP
jgi:GNAT superfamily N-acetyltransferase